MSADNGIVVLVKDTGEGYEYSVVHYFASTLDESGGPYDPEHSVLRDLWARGKKFTNRGEALEHAHDYAKTHDVLEYGI